MRHVIVVALVALVGVSCHHVEREVAAPVEVGAGDWPTIAVFTRPGYVGSGKDAVVTAIWSDGTVIWSTNGIYGGPPYWKGRTSRARIRQFLDWVDAQGMIHDEELLRQFHVGIDLYWSTITVIPQGTGMSLHSGHELYELNTNVVCCNEGIFPLGGHTRDEVLAQEPPDYLRFRKAWAELRNRIEALVPAHGVHMASFDFRIERKMVQLPNQAAQATAPKVADPGR